MRAVDLLAVICCVTLLAGGAPASETDMPMEQSESTIQQVLDRNRDVIMAMPHVVGVGIGKCGALLCIRVLVTECGEGLEEELETLLEGHPYSIEKTEPLQALPSARES